MWSKEFTKDLKEWREKAAMRGAKGGTIPGKIRGEVLLSLLMPPTGEFDFKADLHIHDKNSDGARDPEKTAKEAQENGVFIISQTNHDNTKSVEEYHRYITNMGRYKGLYINGVEVTCKMNGYTVECLVYDFDEKKSQRLIENGEFPFLHRPFKVNRNVELMKQRLKIANEMGISPKFLTMNDFISIEVPDQNGKKVYKPLSSLGLDAVKHIGLRRDKITEEIQIAGKPYKVNYDYFFGKLFKYIAQSEKGRDYLATKDIEIKESEIGLLNVESLDIPQEFKKRYADFNRKIMQSPDSELAVDDSEFWPTFEQVCDFARKTNGVALLAHPFGYGAVKVDPETLMEWAVEKGADGIEVWHGFNTAEQVEKAYKFCKANGLYISLGTDTHDYYSYQGDKTEVGIAPGAGKYDDLEKNEIQEMPLSTHNLHLIGTGKFREMNKESNTLGQ